MKSLLYIFRRIWISQWRYLAIGAALSFAVLAAGLALLGLSGWFITATAAAGLAGLGPLFDVFKPSAGVRFLALARAAARYGERLSSHEAVLRGLAELRLQLLASLLTRPVETLSRLRGSERLNHMTIDVDALDGLALRLVLPMVAGLVALLSAITAIYLLVLPSVAFWQLASFTAGTVIALLVSLYRKKKAARFAQRAMQALRLRAIDLIRGQVELLMAGRLVAQQAAVLDAAHRLEEAQSEVDWTERLSVFLMASTATMTAAGSLYLGSIAVEQGRIDAPLAALGFFMALALLEVAMPLARGLAEMGKMTDAARRIAPQLAVAAAEERSPFEGLQMHSSHGKPCLSLVNIGVRRAGETLLRDVSLTVKSGETVALVGPSGSGKSTLLFLARGLIAPSEGQILLGGHPLEAWRETDRAAMIGLLPQRSALIKGTIADNLRLAKPEGTEEDFVQALQVASLERVVMDRGGLESVLGEGGSGLSGGERRRLALARLALRRPDVLLLDEPTEGLDRETALHVLAAIREAFPKAAIIVAAHRAEERAWADREYRL